MSEEELWNLRIALISGDPLSIIFPSSLQATKSIYKRKSRKMIGDGESNVLTELQRWQLPDTSQRDRPKYFPEPSGPHPGPPRDYRSFFLPPGYPPQLVPGIGLIPHYLYVMDRLTEGTEYYYDQPQ